MNKAPLLILAAGGTGGHMFPAQALAEEMLIRGWRVTLSTDERGVKYTGGFPNKVIIQRVSSATFAKGSFFKKITVPFKIGLGVFNTRRWMRNEMPSVVVGFGGYPAIPAMGAATSLRIPCMIHEQNGVLGRVNSLFSKRVNKVACGTWPTELPDGVLGHPIGNPVRKAVLDKQGAVYIEPGEYPMDILVIGGSQGAKILSDVVPQSLGNLPEALRGYLQVSHQAREEDCGWVNEAYIKAGIQATVLPFFDDIPQRMERAQLVISRSGASSVADISIIGRPAIFVPLAAAIRDEQTANARELVEAGAAILMDEVNFTPNALTHQVKDLLSDGRKARGMAAAALKCARPNATFDLAAMVEELVGDIG